MDARTAGRQMLGATLLAGLFAALFWFALKTWPSLWMFFLLMLLFGLYCAAKLYGVIAGRYPASFWQDVVINLLILLGPAVEDSANGKDPYHAFAVRFSLFIAVALYAWAAIAVLEWLRGRRGSAAGSPNRQRRDLRPVGVGIGAPRPGDRPRRSQGPGRPDGGRALDAARRP